VGGVEFDMAMLETALLILLLIVIGYIGLRALRSAARQVELQEPATKGDIWGLAADVQAISRAVSGVDVSAEVDDIRKELGNLDISITGVGEQLELLRSEVGDIWEDLAGIHGDLYAMRRLLKAIAHHQWTPEWTPE
jgi:hypothetical protein